MSLQGCCNPAVGPGKPFLANGGVLANVARGWTFGATYEYQPGALLNWGNLFFEGDPVHDEDFLFDPTLMVPIFKTGQGDGEHERCAFDLVLEPL